MAHPFLDYEQAMQDQYWRDREPHRIKLNTITEWFSDLSSELRGSGHLRPDHIERCLEEIAFQLDYQEIDYDVNVVRKDPPNVPVYVRLTKTQLEQVR